MSARGSARGHTAPATGQRVRRHGGATAGAAGGALGMGGAPAENRATGVRGSSFAGAKAGAGEARRGGLGGGSATDCSDFFFAGTCRTAGGVRFSWFCGTNASGDRTPPRRAARSSCFFFLPAHDRSDHMHSTAWHHQLGKICSGVSLKVRRGLVGSPCNLLAIGVESYEGRWATTQPLLAHRRRPPPAPAYAASACVGPAGASSSEMAQPHQQRRTPRPRWWAPRGENGGRRSRRSVPGRRPEPIANRSPPAAGYRTVRPCTA